MRLSLSKNNLISLQKSAWTLVGLKTLCPLLVVLGCGWIFFAATHPSIPSPACPLIAYSNQTRDDLKLMFCQAFRQAHQSIYINMYGITDPQIIQALSSHARRGLQITIEYDPSASSRSLLKTLRPFVQLTPIKSKGLMHRKLIVLDDQITFLGSANLTTASLRHHDNLVLGIFDPGLAQFVHHPNAPYFTFEHSDFHGTLWLLPDTTSQALHELLSHLHRATQSIYIAMFTFTHPLIIDELIAAHCRGVQVKIAIDHYTAKGASKKAIEKLHRAGIAILLNQGQHLLHHKWAFIDKTTLLIGSANWTQAAFKKNDDFLLFLSALPPSCRQDIQTLWHHISLESFVYR